jgi:hypothetical protein
MKASSQWEHRKRVSRNIPLSCMDKKYPFEDIVPTIHIFAARAFVLNLPKREQTLRNPCFNPKTTLRRIKSSRQDGDQSITLNNWNVLSNLSPKSLLGLRRYRSVKKMLFAFGWNGLAHTLHFPSLFLGLQPPGPGSNARPRGCSFLGRYQ